MMVSIAAYRLLLHSAFFDWTIVTAFCLDFLPTSSRDSSLFRTLLHGSSSESEDRSILLARSSAFTGCASQSASPSNWLSWRTDQSTALPTYLQSCFTRVVNMTSRRRLRSSASHRLEVGLPPFDSLHQQTGVPSCRRQHVERPSAPRHIFTVTRGLHTASQDFPLLSFLRGHPDMTNLLLLIIIVFLFFWHFLWTLQ